MALGKDRHDSGCGIISVDKDLRSATILATGGIRLLSSCTFENCQSILLKVHPIWDIHNMRVFTKISAFQGHAGNVTERYISITPHWWYKQ
jgi:hypothetical protein